MEIKKRLTSILDNVLGKRGVSGGANEIAYCCPFCNHHKPKLQINVETQQWHCWVCDKKGRSLFTLLKGMKATKQQFEELGRLVDDKPKKIVEDEIDLIIPGKNGNIIRLPEIDIKKY